MAFAEMYIGDSQTMAAEAAVLGTPAIRFNDFVGEIGYLEELEHTFGLTYGIRTNDTEKLYQTIRDILAMSDFKNKFQEKRKIMLSQKIDLATYMTKLFEEYV